MVRIWPSAFLLVVCCPLPTKGLGEPPTPPSLLNRCALQKGKRGLTRDRFIACSYCLATFKAQCAAVPTNCMGKPLAAKHPRHVALVRVTPFFCVTEMCMIRSLPAPRAFCLHHSYIEAFWVQHQNMDYLCFCLSLISIFYLYVIYCFPVIYLSKKGNQWTQWKQNKLYAFYVFHLYVMYCFSLIS